MPTLAHPKNFLIFALSHSYNGVNHRFYRNINKRLGVVSLVSYYPVICECDNLKRATLSFLSIIKFFTNNVTLSRKFSTREQQYLTTNAQPSDTGRKSSQKFATTEKCCTFVPQQLFICGSNPFRFIIFRYKRLGVVYSRSICPANSGCCKLGKHYAFFIYKFINFLKFFTNATTCKKFSTREQQYLTTNAQPSDTGQKRTTQKEFRETSLLPAIGLLIREFYGYVRGLRTQVVQNLFQNFQYCYSVCPNQRKGILCQWQNILRSLRKTDEDHSGRRQYAGSYKPTAYCIKPTAGNHFHNSLVYLVFPALLCAVRGFYFATGEWLLAYCYLSIANCLKPTA
ncbi:hypothetical protein HMPREF9700_00240 [Bergeyella zoohelcum CCUG 30536]|uniref:Uncharacterized protein n=1 Tax=Bergeyella zoohelcum TaxID=1015 RepID=A0A376C016_9FLAO|nr:hypothetical protein HMPREF9700_00240 [Bergeyella zoohelcum CCUG 30536]SSZ47165.1 Uncharacterised protein [Bergeyella zoohelcum]